VISLAKRPVLFTLVRALAEAWPEDVARTRSSARAFRLKLADESPSRALGVSRWAAAQGASTIADVSATSVGLRSVPRARVKSSCWHAP